MENNEILSIKEFSIQAGVTQQAIYKQLNNKLKTYVVIVENKKMLKKSALQEVYGVSDIKRVKQQVDKKLNDSLNQKLIEMLQKELEQKDKQIADLSKALTDTTQALKASQMFQANSEKKLLEQEQKQEEPENVPEPKKHWWSKLR